MIEVAAILRAATVIGMAAVVLGELLSGFSLGSQEGDNRRELGAFLGSPRVIFLPANEGTAEL